MPESDDDFCFPLHVMVTGFEQASGAVKFSGLMTEDHEREKCLPIFRSQDEVWAYSSANPPLRTIDATNLAVHDPTQLREFAQKAQRNFRVTHVCFDPAGTRNRLPLSELMEILADQPEPQTFSERLTALIQKHRPPDSRLYFPLYAIAGGTDDAEPEPSDFFTLPQKAGEMLLLFDSPLEATDVAEKWPDRFPTPHRWVRFETPEELNQLLVQLRDLGVMFVGLDPLGTPQKFRIDAYLSGDG